jgi:hypothetical protein
MKYNAILFVLFACFIISCKRQVCLDCKNTHKDGKVETFPTVCGETEEAALQAAEKYHSSDTTIKTTCDTKLQ